MGVWLPGRLWGLGAMITPGDVFTGLPSVPEPEFTHFDLNALRVEDSDAGRVSEPRPVRARIEKIRIPVWLLVLVSPKANQYVQLTNLAIEAKECKKLSKR
jgi:hypothetical protein